MARQRGLTGPRRFLEFILQTSRKRRFALLKFFWHIYSILLCLHCRDPNAVLLLWMLKWK